MSQLVSHVRAPRHRQANLSHKSRMSSQESAEHKNQLD